jgi:putative hydrolase of the HAD superfamily
VEFCDAFIACAREAESVRNATQHEVTARERFRSLGQRLRIPDGPATEAFMQGVIAEQTRQLRQAMEFPAENRAALDTLRPRYRLAVLSNFDHAPTVEATLAHFGIRDHFEVVVVSADTGWRKPHPEIFRETLRRLRLDARQAIFIGDTPDADVLGPHGVGMETIWIDRGTATLPAGAPSPTHVVPRFADVIGHL